LPRLYKLLRIINLFKVLRMMKLTKGLNIMIFCRKVNERVFKMVAVGVFVFFIVHLMGCFWFLTASFEDFEPDTWVARNGYIDSGVGVQYLASIYWSFSTLTTVGFGELNAQTISEKILAIIWMILGVGFYSFTIGNLSSIIASIDT